MHHVQPGGGRSALPARVPPPPVTSEHNHSCALLASQATGHNWGRSGAQDLTDFDGPRRQSHSRTPAPTEDLAQQCLQPGETWRLSTPQTSSHWSPYLATLICHSCSGFVLTCGHNSIFSLENAVRLGAGPKTVFNILRV